MLMGFPQHYLLAFALASLTLFSNVIATSSVSSLELDPGLIRISSDEQGQMNATAQGVLPVTPLGEIKLTDPISTPLINGCPQSCHIAGLSPDNWTQIHQDSELEDCNQPLLFDFNIQNEPSQYKTIRACAMSTDAVFSEHSHALGRRQDISKMPATDLQAIKTYIADSESCGAKTETLRRSMTVIRENLLATQANKDSASAASLIAIYLKQKSLCGSAILFTKFGNAIVGVYVGSDIEKTSAGEILESEFKDQLAKGTQVLQICQPHSQASQTIGAVAVEKVVDLDLAHIAVQTWANGECVEIDVASKIGQEFDLVTLISSSASKNATLGRSNFISPRRELAPRADCRSIQVVSGDSCASLASRCGISGADITKYNTKTNFCATLAVKQWICCSSGTLPDKTPKPQANGVCAIYTVQPNDGCQVIAANFGITQQSIGNFNNATWAWAGCGRLQIGQVICVSTGKTPMPAAVEGVVCGPQKVGTVAPTGNYDGWTLAKLNQCPLKACCSGWGYCGTTSEFCVESLADTKAPGSSKPGTNSCISNCGMGIVNNASPPPSFARVGYFEGFNRQRGCMHLNSIDLAGDDFSYLTHVHFAFAGLSTDFKLTFDPDVTKQFDVFLGMKANFKKILSVGGWAESTEPGTFQRYRDAVKPANRDIFAKNIVEFMKTNSRLDGIDFDWEYPGAPDIPGLPAGEKTAGVDYLKFLTTLRGLLAKEKSLSIALPASFWYLQAFPVDRLAPVVDYFIYMTYDLHGQWDYGNKFANPGCSNGNCLRSHVNKTETENALSMITKAGVPAGKIFVGISSYGRSFRMSNPACTGPLCTFTGAFGRSEAEKGACTGTGGYISNGEIRYIIAQAEEGINGVQAKTWYDKATDSDIMVYGSLGKGMTDWVAYMDGVTKGNRVDWIRKLNFGGTSDWAVDLDVSDLSSYDYDGNKLVTYEYNPPSLECDSEEWATTLETLESSIYLLNPSCRGMAILSVLRGQLRAALAAYQIAAEGYDSKFKFYVTWVKDSIDGSLHDFVQIPDSNGDIAGRGLKFMDCVWKSEGSSGSGPCTDAKFVFKELAHPGQREVKYTMRDEAGFYQALSEDFGIERDWVRWIEYDQTAIVCPPCPPQPIGSNPCNQECAKDYIARTNYPRRITDSNKINVANPKELVDKALPNAEALIDAAAISYLEMRLQIMEASEQDVVTAYSLPIFMLDDAAESLAAIKDIGEEVEKAAKKKFIMDILTIVFSVIPFAGFAAGALMGGAARIAQIALIIGEAGNAAITIVDIVDNPLSAPFAIMGMLLGVGGIRANPRAAFREAAVARRKLTDADLRLFSAEFRRKDALVQNMVKACPF